MVRAGIDDLQVQEPCHASEQWRYIRYENGDEELYHNAVDPYEWTNLATLHQYDPIKAELARWLPKTDAPWPQQAMEKSSKKALKKAKNGQKPIATPNAPAGLSVWRPHGGPSPP